MFPLVDDLATQADQVARLAMHRRKQGVARSRTMRVADVKAEIPMTHRILLHTQRPNIIELISIA
jgi:hypothetical protein